MKNIKEWMTIAENASKIVTNDPGNDTAEDIRQLAAEQLILAGYPYDTDRNGNPVIETGDYRFMVYAVENSVEKPAPAVPKMRQPIQKEPVAATVVTRKITTPEEPATEPLRQAPKELIPEADDGITVLEETAEQPAPAPASVPEPAKVEAPQKKAPVYDENATRPLYVAQKEDPKNTAGMGYVDHMAKDDLLMDYHTVRVKSASGVEIVLEVFASPMTVREGEQEILVWASDGVQSMTTGPDGHMKTRLIHFNGIDLIVSGEYKNGQFTSKVEPTKRMADGGVTVSDTVVNMNGSGHIKLDDVGIEIRLVPTTHENNRNGSAQFYYMIQMSGCAPIFGDNYNMNRVFFEKEGEQYELIARWSNNVLYSAVRSQN